MSLTPAKDEREAQKKKDAIEKCGVNRGPHDYIPIEWSITPSAKRVTRLLCRVCFCHIAMNSLIENYRDISV